MGSTQHKFEVYLRESQKLKSFASADSNYQAPEHCQIKDELL
jgi:hypothetical protein